MRQQNFAGAGVLLAHLKIKMRQQKLTLMFFSSPPLSSMGTFLHVTHRMTKIGSMILLAHLKFCWRILNFAGAVFEVQVAPANDLRQQNFAGAAPENTSTEKDSSSFLHRCHRTRSHRRSQQSPPLSPLPLLSSSITIPLLSPPPPQSPPSSSCCVVVAAAVAAPATRCHHCHHRLF